MIEISEIILAFDKHASAVMALATLVLVVATICYVFLTYRTLQELKKQSVARDRREMVNKVYLPLLRNLKSIIEVPIKIEETNKGPAFTLQNLEENCPHLLSLVSRDLLAQIEKFDKEYERYQNSFEDVWKKINGLLKEEVHAHLGVQAGHMKNVRLHAGQHSRDIYFFIYEGISPQDWFTEKEEENLVPIKPIIRPSDGASSNFKKTSLLLKDFDHLYIFTQKRIEDDDRLKSYLKLRRRLLKVDARFIIRKIEAHLKE